MIHPSQQARAAAYDAQPYYGRPCPESHPGRLAALAGLCGLPRADVARCRVLEIGCGDGQNLIAIADSLPGARCVGIDLSPRHIAMGQAEVAALGLRNIDLRQADLLQLAPGDPALGTFDFIIAHCVYSWTPQAVQDRLLALCQAHLAPAGVAFVSYNLLPGWRIVQVLRDFLSFHARGAADPAERLAQAAVGLALLPQLTGDVPGELSAFVSRYSRDFAARLASLGLWRDQALVHDVIGEPCTPVYFSTFVNHAGRFGLRYLTDGEYRSRIPATMTRDTVQALLPHVGSPMDLDQYVDFAAMRTFRQSLLCRADQTPRPDPRPGDLAGLHVTSRWAPPPGVTDDDLRGDAIVEFSGTDDAKLRTNHPLTKAAFCILADRAPAAAAYDDLGPMAQARLGTTAAPAAADLDILGNYVLRAFASDQGLVRLSAHAPTFPTTPSARPLARPLARRQATRGDEVTNLFHDNIAIDAQARALIPLLDGTRDLPALQAASPAPLPPLLSSLAQNALLIA